MIVHPAFDLKTRTWFVEEDNLEVEAPSLRELKRLLPQGTKIEGYRPLGTQPWKKVVAEVSTLSTRAPSITHITASVKIPQHVQKEINEKHKGKERVYSYDAILDLWVLGYNAAYIAKRQNILRESVSKIVFSRRQKSDPRAIKHDEHMTEQQKVNNQKVFDPLVDKVETSNKVAPDVQEFWTPEKKAELSMLCKLGFSASQIQAQLGAPTRNSVCGQRSRMLAEQRKKSV